MKKIIVLMVALLIFTFSSTAMAAGYKDVKTTDWFYQPVTVLTGGGYINGYGNGLFLPNNNINRAEFVTILARASGEDLSNFAPSFSDVPASFWGYKQIGWAAEKGITSGKGNNKFYPNDKITRQEMATMIYRFMVYQGNAPAISGDPYYSDFSQVDSYAKDPVRALYSYGGISGMGNNKFMPNNTSTRAQAAQIIYNSLILNDRQRTTVFAKNFVDFKFVKGGASPETGFDSAGFVKYIYAHFGVTLTGDDTELMTQGTEVSRNNLNMGDLVCFGGSVPHVGIYIGNSQFIHAANSEVGVVITDLGDGNYYDKNFKFGRRLFDH